MRGNKIDAIIEGHEVQVLVDTGAAVSVMSENFRRRIGKVLISETGPILQVASGGCVSSMGRCVSRVEINGLLHLIEFVVFPTCSHDVILGWNFLESSAALINCAKSELYLNDSLLSEETEPVRRLTALEDQIIPPNSIIAVCVLAELGCEEDVIIECHKDLILKKDLIIPSAIISVEKNKSKLWVVNGSSKPQVIPAGMCIATMEIFEENSVCAIDDTSVIVSDEVRDQRKDSRLLQLIYSDLELEKKSRLMNVLHKFKGTFDFDNNLTASESKIKHKIETGDHLPIKQRPYRIAPKERRIIEDEVSQMMEKGIIKPSSSPWSSPVVLVRKKIIPGGFASIIVNLIK